MKTRTVVHIALNAKNERVRVLACICGRLASFSGSFFGDLKNTTSRPCAYWFDANLIASKSLSQWKRESKIRGAVRFQRVTLIGESK